MFDFFKNLAEIIGFAVDFVVNTLQSIVMLFTTIPKALSYLTYSVALLPPAVVAFATLAIATSILLVVLGRNS